MEVRMMRKHDQTLVLDKGVLADTFLKRLVGLIGKKSMADSAGMLFPANNSIHMWMMSMPIDAVFLKKLPDGWEIMALYPKLKPWKLLPVGCFKADDTLELAAGTIERLKLKKGEVLCIAS